MKVNDNFISFIIILFYSILIGYSFFAYSYSQYIFYVECQGNNCDPLEVGIVCSWYIISPFYWYHNLL